MSERQSKKKFNSISYYFFFAFLGLSLVILLIEGLISIYAAFRTEQSNISFEQKRIAENAGRTVEAYIDDKFKLLEITATTTDLVKKTPSEQELIFKKILQKDKTFQQIALYNSRNEKLTYISRSSKRFSYEMDKRIDKSLFNHVLNGEYHASNSYIDPLTNEPLILLAVPIKDLYNNIQNVLIVEVNLKNMWEVVSNLPVGKNGLLYVVDEKGTLLAFKDISRVLRGENVSNLHEVKEYMSQVDVQEHDDSVIVEGINGTTSVSTYFKLRNEPSWAIIIEDPVLDAYRPVIQEIIVLGFVMMVTFVLVILLSVVLSRRITKQIILLNTAAKKISLGDLNATIDVSTNDEIGELAESFQEMTKKLKESYFELESKVKEKTAELEEKVNESDRMNRLMVGRELKMIELKQELEKMKKELEKKDTPNT